MKKEGQIRIPSGCAISAVISKEGRRMTGEKIIESMIPMHDRSNGLGGGFAAYGIDQLRMSETEAHRYIEKQAMDRCVSRRVIAEKMLTAEQGCFALPKSKSSLRTHTGTVLPA